MKTRLGFTGDTSAVLHAVYLDGPLTEKDLERLKEELSVIEELFSTDTRRFAGEVIDSLQSIAENLNEKLLVLFVYELTDKGLFVYGRPFPLDRDIEEDVVGIASYSFLFPFIKRIVTEKELSDRDFLKFTAILTLTTSFEKVVREKEPALEKFVVVGFRKKDSESCFTLLAPVGSIWLCRFPKGTRAEEILECLEVFAPVGDSLPDNFKDGAGAFASKGDVGIAILVNPNLLDEKTLFVNALVFNVEPYKEVKQVFSQVLGDEDVKTLISFQEIFASALISFREARENGESNEKTH